MIRNIREIYKLLKSAETETGRFGQKAGIGCPSGCGLCCLRPGIEARVTEFLPAAWHLVVTGKYTDILAAIETRQGNPCIFYNHATDGHCSMYEYRGLICRLFGYSSSRNKSDEKVFYSCRILKESLKEPMPPAVLEKAPSIPDYYLRLYSLDPGSDLKTLPINEAIRAAIHRVSTYFDYHKKRA